MRAPPTPSSLKWLINRRARICGEIARLDEHEQRRGPLAKSTIATLERSLRQARINDARISRIYDVQRLALIDDLAATDRLMRQHEVAIDPEIVRPVRSQRVGAITDHGRITRAIFTYLRLANGAACTALQVASHMADKGDVKFRYRAAEFSELRYRVRKRMQKLAAAGKLIRVPTQVGCLEGRWCLPDLSHE